MTTTTLSPEQSAKPRQVRDLPSPPGLPLIGHLHKIDPLHLHNQLDGWGQTLGTPYQLKMAHVQAVVFDDVEIYQQVLRERPQRYRRGANIESVLTEMGGNGLFSVEGDAWKPQRQLVMQALNATHFRSFFPTLQAITSRLLRRWQRAAAAGTVIEMGEDLMRYTVDVTCALAFGEDPNTLESEGDKIQDHLALIFPMIMKRISTPFAYWRYLRLPQDRALDRALGTVHAHIRALMTRARERMRTEPSETPRHLLEAMLIARDQPDSGLNDDDVAANVLTLLLAGEDTTANSLAWTMPYLSADRPLQQRLHEDAKRLFANADVCPEHDTLSTLDLFEALATESGRLRPVVPFMVFEPLQDVVLGNVALAQGTKMFFLNRPALRDANQFANPERYDPERWTRRHAEGSGAHEPKAYLQFGAGPRVCPGRHLARMEMRLVLSMLLRNFEVELTIPAAELEEVSAFTMMPRRMPVRLHARAG